VPEHVAQKLGIELHSKRDWLPSGLSLTGFVCSLLTWRWLLTSQLAESSQFAIAWLCPIAALLAAWLGRRALDRAPGLRGIARITAIVHFFVMTLLGSAIISAVDLASKISWGRFPFPAGVGRALVWITGIALAFTVLNLAVRGLGAPFAIVLSRRLTADWCYAYARNPMVLCLFAFLVALACMLRSSLLLLWIATATTPAMAGFLRMYEERELELRFGASYKEYRQKVPMLWPRWPRRG